MASGTPVVASNVSAMPEVVGEAGILVSPQRPTEIADAIDRVTSDVALSSELTEKGLKRTAQFTWAATARKIKAVLEDAAKAASSAARNR